jgi:uncharacterized RDD family membrane protein YckC
MNESHNWPAPVPIPPQEVVFANYWLRIIASISDTLNIYAIVLLPSIVFGILATNDYLSDTSMQVITLIVQIGIIVLIAYWHGSKGGSPLRLKTGTLIVHENTGELVGFKVALLRTAAATIPPLLLFDVNTAAFVFVVLSDRLWPLWDTRNQTLHDKIAKTIVIMK